MKETAIEVASAYGWFENVYPLKIDTIRISLVEGPHMSGQWSLAFVPYVTEVLTDTASELPCGFSHIFETTDAMCLIYYPCGSAVNVVANMVFFTRCVATEVAACFDKIAGYAATASKTPFCLPS